MLPDQISRRRLLRFGALSVGVSAILAIVYGGIRNLMDMPQKPPQSLPLSSIPTILPRVDWGARPPNHEAIDELGFAKSPLETEWYVYPDKLSDVYNTVAIHHSAGLLASNETMTYIQNLHMDTNHWADVGYHYGIDKDGVIYEGRDIAVRGVNVAGHNTGTIGVVVMGNFEEDQPLPLQLEALQTLVNWLASTYALTHLAGHGEFNPETVCPGKNMLPYLDQLAHNAGLLRGTAGHVPPTA
jgi:hypothetical protein